MKINREWHLQHPMPKEPTIDERIEWHLLHIKNCGCRDIPDKVKEAMKQRNIDIPDYSKIQALL